MERSGAVYDFRRTGTGSGWAQAPELPCRRGKGDQLGVAIALNELDRHDRGAGLADGSGARPIGWRRLGAQPCSPRAPGRSPVRVLGGDPRRLAVVGAFRENGTGAAYLFQPPVELVVAPEVVNEDQAMVAVGLRTREGGRGASSVRFGIKTVAGTATERATEADAGDYLGLNEQVTLDAAGAAALAIRIFDDDVCEERETFQVILSDSAGRVIQAVEVAIDDDDPTAGLELSSPALLHTSEDGASTMASVRLTCQPAAPVILAEDER